MHWRNLLVGLAVVGSIGGYLYDKAEQFESESWTEYDDDRYTVSFPTSDTPKGLPGDELTGMLVVWRDHAYTAGWMPEDRGNRDLSNESVLEGLKKFTEDVGTVNSSRMHTYEGLPAFDFEITSKDHGSGQFIRYLRKGDRMYLLWVSAFEGKPLDLSAPPIQKFLASFHAR